MSKMTKREMFAEIRKAVISNPEMVEFIDHEVELLDNKAKTPKKPTATQVENEGYKASILLALSEADAPVTIKELQVACPSIAELTPQRVSALLTQLRKDKQVCRSYEKKVAYFALGSEPDAE